MAEESEIVRKSKKFKGVSKKNEVEGSEILALEGADNLEINNIIDDIEDYLKNSIQSQNNQTATLPPVIKFNKNWMLSVTELSCQLWCEKQVEYTLLTGRKRVTEEMEEGIKRHEELELEDHDLVEVEVETEEDYLGLKLLNSIILLEQLQETGKCRELWLFDTIENYTFSGIIDQLTIAMHRHTKEKCVIISDTKTRKTKRDPSLSQIQGASLQVQLYCIMLEDTKNGKVNFAKLYESLNCDKYAPFKAVELIPEGCLANLQKRYLRAFKKLPKVSKMMNLEYEHEGTVFRKSEVDLRKENILLTVNYLCTFWDGLREADHVKKNESWKCKLCQFKDECTVTPLIRDRTQ
ncbi:hypothetical protein MACJ_000046 [Theileria orientalis]|uniref:Exonuclease V n=1 Tax=Theileria orientalis TaxID=68886 RepID=A0A976M3E8_THEOR|nr:hypothetical protein MACJ_000046 [Theileria orientalis]